MKQKITLPLDSSANYTDRTTDNEIPSDEKIIEKSLIDSFKRGEESAFKKIVETYQWRLYCSALKILKSKDDAEEVVAETFAIAFKERKKFRWESGIYTYLWKICFNLSYHKKLKTSRNPIIFSLDENLISDGSTPEEPESDISGLYLEGKPRFPITPLYERFLLLNKSASDSLIKSAVRQAIAQLPRHHIKIILLKDFYAYSYEEISRILSIPRGTVMSRLARAREALKKTLKKFYPQK